MVKFISFYLITMIFISCQKNKSDELTIKSIEADYFDSNIDSIELNVYGKDPFNALGVEKWIKNSDRILTMNQRLLSYKIQSRFSDKKDAYFLIDPNGLKTSSELPSNYLSVYKTDLLDEINHKVYEERSALQRRLFFSYLVQINNNNYTGKCIQSTVNYTTIQNDSMYIKTVIDEFYAINKGLVYIKQNNRYFINSIFSHDSSIYKYRVN